MEQRGEAAGMIRWIGSSSARLYWTDSKLGTLSRGICRRGLVDRLEQVGVHVQVQHTENGAMEER